MPVISICLCLVTALASVGQALPPPRDGDIRVLYYEIQNETTVWLTLEPKPLDGKPAPPLMLLTLNLHFPGKRPKTAPQSVEMHAYAGLLWAPRLELAIVLDDREKIDLVHPGVMGLVSGGASDFLPGTVPIATLRQMAEAKRVRVRALGLEFELSELQRDAVRAFLERVLSDNPAQFR